MIRQRFGKDFDSELWTNAELWFRGQLGYTTLVEVNALEPISCQYCKYVMSEQDDDGIKDDVEDDYRFVYKEKDIQEGDTPSSLGMMDDPDIIVRAIHQNKVKITILHDVMDCRCDFFPFKDEPLLYVFEGFAEDLKDVSLKNLVFSFKGRRLYTFDSALVLKLSDGDVIHATPVNEYHTEGCICCQKKRNPLEFATES
jgi:hypothetical protein